MRRTCLLLSLLILAGCRTAPDVSPEPMSPPLSEYQRIENLKSALGMSRTASDLGFTEKSFNPCGFGWATPGSCKQQYFSVVHFQLLCRDSEGSVSAAPLVLQPIVASNVRWKVGGLSGGTQTDAQGYGQFSVVSPKSTRGQRLILRIGPQFVSFSVSEVSKIVLPKNFCRPA